MNLKNNFAEDPFDLQVYTAGTLSVFEPNGDESYSFSGCPVPGDIRSCSELFAVKATSTGDKGFIM